MKNLLLLLTIIALISCEKEVSYESKPINLQSRSVFPSYIQLGADTTYPRTDSICFTNYRCYLALECIPSSPNNAPATGTQFYQIAGPNNAIIGTTTYNFYDVPTAKGLIPGKYTFVGRGFVIGYCENIYQNINVYDTINVTILKSRRRIK